MKKLVKFTGILAVAILAAAQAHATLLASDTFSYSDGNLAGNSPGGITGTNAWATFSGSGTDISVSGGRAVVNSANSPDDGLAFGGTHTNDILYGSAVIDFTTLPTTTGAYVAMFRQDGSTFYVGKLWAQAFGDGGVKLGVSASSNLVSATWATSLSLNTDYNIAWKIDQSVSNAVMSLWVNPVDESSTSISSGALFDDHSTFHDNLNSFALRQNSGGGVYQIDNLLIGTTFADVVPEPSTVALVGAGLIGMLAMRRRRS